MSDLASIRTFPQLVKYLKDELDWPITSDDFEDLFYDYTPQELGIDSKSAVKIKKIKRLRSLSISQPWGVFFVEFEPKKLPIVALRRILSSVSLKQRASANHSERKGWEAQDLLFISNYGDEGDGRQITFAHFAQDPVKQDLPTLKVLGWDSLNTPLHINHVASTLHEHLHWPEDETNVQEWRTEWRRAFGLRYGEVVATSRALAIRLAELAGSIRNRINTALEIETDEGPLTTLMRAFREALVHDLDDDDFADMYSQTIAYGLLSARIANPKADTADDLAAQMPVTNPFLRELLETFLQVGGRRGDAATGASLDFDELGISEVVELLDQANMEAVLHATSGIAIPKKILSSISTSYSSRSTTLRSECSVESFTPPAQWSHTLFVRFTSSFRRTSTCLMDWPMYPRGETWPPAMKDSGYQKMRTQRIDSSRCWIRLRGPGPSL